MAANKEPAGAGADPVQDVHETATIVHARDADFEAKEQIEFRLLQLVASRQAGADGIVEGRVSWERGDSCHCGDVRSSPVSDLMITAPHFGGTRAKCRLTPREAELAPLWVHTLLRPAGPLRRRWCLTISEIRRSPGNRPGARANENVAESSDISPLHQVRARRRATSGRSDDMT
jgi:hypothetical protein